MDQPNMKLWLLRPRENFAKGNNPWHPWYDKYFGFVIRAETEDEARSIATEADGPENHELMNENGRMRP